MLEDFHHVDLRKELMEENNDTVINSAGKLGNKFGRSCTIKKLKIESWKR